MKKVFVSAGHSRFDQGASWETLKENELTIRVRDEFKRLYKGEAMYPSDNLTLKETIDWTNERAKLEDLAIEIHLNSHNDSKIRGTEAYYWKNNRFAEIISQKVSEKLGIPNRGAKPDSLSYLGSLGFLRQIKCESVILECFYLTNEEDRASFDPIKIAEGIKEAVDIFYASPVKAEEETTKKELNRLQAWLDTLKKRLNQLLNNRNV